MPKRQERVQSKWNDVTKWERYQSMRNLQVFIKTLFSLEKEGMKFWEAIVGASGLRTF